MDGFFEFVAILITSYLLLGCLAVAMVALALRCLSLNAATRHNIWLGAFLILLLMPLLSILPPGEINEAAPVSSSEPTYSVSDPLTLVAEVSQPPATSTQQRVSQPGNDFFDAVAIPATRTSFLSKLSDNVLQVFSQLWLGVALFLFIVCGTMLKIFSFFRSYRNLRRLFLASESINHESLDSISNLVGQVGIRHYPLIRHSAEVYTPLTSGIFQPWIVLPSSLLEDDSSPQLLQQVLLHELAHIKRRDPLIASLQALVSIFLFWHPAVYYVNQKIRFERELACDDWVIKHTQDQDTAYVKTYAKNLLNIAESLQQEVSIAHSVACVHTSHGLANRIKILLNSNVDHSTSSRRTPAALISCSLIVLLLITAPLWPQLPKTYAEEETLSELEPAGVATEPLPTGLALAEASGLLTEAQVSSRIAEPGSQLSEPLQGQAPPVAPSNPLPESQSPQLLAESASAIEQSQPSLVESTSVLPEPQSPQLRAEPTELIAEPQQPGAFAVSRDEPAQQAQPGQAIIEDLTQAVVQSDPLSEELALLIAQVPLQNSLPGDMPVEPGSAEIEIALILQDSNSLGQAVNVEITETSDADVELTASELGREFFSTLARQQQELNSTAGPTRPVELITVIGKQTPRSMHFRIERSEAALYEMYNELNSSDEFDIICERRSTTGSFIARRVCEPVFLDSYRAENAREVMEGAMRDVGPFGRLRGAVFGAWQLSDRELRSRASDSYDLVMQEMRNLAMVNQDFMARLQRIDELKTEYQEMVEPRGGFYMPFYDGSNYRDNYWVDRNGNTSLYGQRDYRNNGPSNNGGNGAGSSSGGGNGGGGGNSSGGGNSGGGGFSPGGGYSVGNGNFGTPVSAESRGGLD